MMRNDFVTAANSLATQIGSAVHNMTPLVRYRVAFMWCRPSSIIVFLDWGGPFPDGIDLRLCDIVDGSIDPGWMIGRHGLDAADYIILVGPEFWAADYHWYERLLDDDPLALKQYRDYLQGPLNNPADPPGI